MTGPVLHLVVPGPLDQRTGGYLYDARMAGELREMGWEVETHSLTGSFPLADREAEESLTYTLARIPDGSLVLLDGLGIGGNPKPLAHTRERLRLLALVHHPLGDETGLDPEERDQLLASEKEALSLVRGVVVTSGFTARRLEELGIPAELIRVAEPGTDPAAAATGPGEDAVPHLLCIASLTPRKGQDVLVEALHQLRGRPWRCTLAGNLQRDPAFVGEVRRRVEELALGDRIHFAGECDAGTLETLYRESSLLVLPSHYEGYGMVLTEALARGLPVVSTTGGAIPWTVPGDAALLVPPGDAEALAEALGRVLPPTGDELRRELARAALRHREALPGWEDMALKLASGLEGLAGGR